MAFNKQYLLLALSLFFTCGGVSAQADWELQKEKEGVRVYTRDIKDSDFKAFRAATEMEASLNQVLAVLLDVDRYEEWMPDTKEAEVLEQPSDAQTIYYVATAAPWPVSDRDGVYSMKAVYDPDMAQVALSVRAKPDKLEEKKGYVRVTRSDAVWKLTDTGEGKVKVEYEVAAEPGGSIPAWLAKMKVVSIPLETLEALQARLAQNLYPGKQFDFMNP